MGKNSLAALQAAFKTPERGNTLPNNYYAFWNMNYGETATVRFLPDKNPDNPFGFLFEKHSHVLEINGERKTVPCLKMYEEENGDCPICAVSKSYYDAGDKVNGKKYWRKGNHLAQVLVVEDPLDADDETGETAEGKVKYVSLAWQLYNVIKDALMSGDLEQDPSDYEGGCNFIIKKTQQGEYASYQTGSKFAKRETDLTADEIEYVDGQITDLRDLLPANPGREKIEGMLTAALTGEDYVEGSSSDDAPTEEAPKAEKPKAAKAKPTAAKEAVEVVEASDTDADADGDAEDILAAIRNRRNKS